MHARNKKHPYHPGLDAMGDHHDNPFGPPGRGRGPGHGRGPGRHGRGRRRNRVSRGEVRNAVLQLLADEPMHGYQVMQELEERSGGGWQPSPGSIYPTLQLLADEGLIVAEEEGGKNIFSLTSEGRKAVDAIEEPPAWERFDGDGMADVVKLRRSVHQLGMAAKQVVQAGSDQQVQAAHQILTDARKALYKLLASDE